MIRASSVLLLCALLAGCSITDAANRPVDTGAAAAQVARLEDTLTALREHVATLADQFAAASAFIDAQAPRIDAARELAERSGSDAAKALATALEQARDMAQANLPRIENALTNAQDRLPQVESAVAAARASLDDLARQGGAQPLWYVIGTLLLPLAIKAAQVATAGIPGVGAVVGGLSEQLVLGLWNTLASQRQKSADEQQAARSVALDHQIAVTNALVTSAGGAADPILAAAKRRQLADGTHATLRPLVAAAEVGGAAP